VASTGPGRSIITKKLLEEKSLDAVVVATPIIGTRR
jgi:hypothetical protein